MLYFNQKQRQRLGWKFNFMNMKFPMTFHPDHQLTQTKCCFRMGDERSIIFKFMLALYFNIEMFRTPKIQRCTDMML